jgi:putative yapH protein|nr:MAG TPA: Neck appendage like protein [Bacteriophage sp.]
MAKNYILNVKDIDGNWVGIPTLQGVGITNITQQNKKLIIDLSNNTKKEFNISSVDSLNGVDLLNKINNDVQKNTQQFRDFKDKLEIPSPADISTYFRLKGIVDVDLNTLTKDTDVGYYYVANGATNKPTESDFALMFVYKNMSYIMQIYVIDSRRIYIRASGDDGLNWNNWEKISSGNNDNTNLRIKFNSSNSATFLSDNARFLFNPTTISGNTPISDFHFNKGNPNEYANIYCGTLNANNKLIAQDEIISSGDITAFSDIRLKTNIEKIENALDKVCQLSGYTYDMNDKRRTGVIAQEVEKVLPEVVQDREDGYKTVAYGNMIGLLIEAIKELKEEIKVIKNGN